MAGETNAKLYACLTMLEVHVGHQVPTLLSMRLVHPSCDALDSKCLT